MKPLTVTFIAIMMLMQYNTVSAGDGGQKKKQPLHDCYYLEVYESVDFCAIATCENWEYADMITDWYYSDSCYICKEWTGCPENND